MGVIIGGDGTTAAEQWFWSRLAHLDIQVYETRDPVGFYVSGKFAGTVRVPGWAAQEALLTHDLGDAYGLLAEVIESGVRAAMKYEALHGPPPGRDG